MSEQNFETVECEEIITTTKVNDLFNLASDGRLIDLHLSKWELSRRDENGSTILHHAAKNFHVDSMKTILDIDPSIFFITDNRGQTGVHYAAKNTKILDINFIEKFLKFCTNFNEDSLKTQDDIGLTPLHIAVSRNNEEFVRILLKYKSYLNLEAVDNFGSTALFESVKCGWTSICG